MGAILADKADEIIPSNYHDHSRDQELLDREQKAIQSKTEFEQKVINKHRTIFSSTMNPDRVLSSDEMTIWL